MQDLILAHGLFIDCAFAWVSPCKAYLALLHLATNPETLHDPPRLRPHGGRLYLTGLSSRPCLFYIRGRGEGFICIWDTSHVGEPLRPSPQRKFSPAQIPHNLVPLPPNRGPLPPRLPPSTGPSQAQDLPPAQKTPSRPA